MMAWYNRKRNSKKNIIELSLNWIATMQRNFQGKNASLEEHSCVRSSNFVLPVIVHIVWKLSESFPTLKSATLQKNSFFSWSHCIDFTLKTGSLNIFLADDRRVLRRTLRETQSSKQRCTPCVKHWYVALPRHRALCWNQSTGYTFIHIIYV